MASVRQRINRDLGRENEQGEVVYYVASHPWKRKRTSTPIVTREGQTPENDDKKTMNWQQRFSLLLINLLWDSHDVLAFVGFLVEWTLNFLALNGSFWTLPFRCIFDFNELVFPKEGESNYHTLIWQLDPRTKLYTDTSASAKAHSTKTDTGSFPVEGTGSRATLDVTIMASKLVYENPEVIKKVVEQDWNMHFVGFYTCWNECHKERSTVAFIFADKPQKMNAIVIVWRGTEPFNAWDWSTDIDFSWARFENGMAVHLGFLEALGLCHPTSGLSNDIIKNDSQMLAYDDITKIVAKLLYENPHAQLFVTGHSLGGALAAVYGAMLYYNAETEITNRLAAVYTFGQPRVGDQNFANYANQKLKGHYNRVVYCNDIVPRVPFDNKLFQFKHFGGCHYYDNWYNGMILPEEPARNFFAFNFIRLRITAFCELIQSAFILTIRHGPEYQESAVSLLARVVGLAVPGVIAHNPLNYVNAVRLGPRPLVERIEKDIFQTLRSVFFAFPALPGNAPWDYLDDKLSTGA
ncbi:unnamed protein product [Sphagnum troendelagicum]|uniref:Fungal lipase-type domain-containing protein n=1 Tax=Sphagnum troendelagicum TaxID=128251 RepID=A0ABP0UFW2_9BRYO